MSGPSVSGTPRFSRTRGIDPSIFREAQKPTPKVRDQAEKYRREAEKAVASILLKEGVSVDYSVRSAGKRVIVELTGIAQELAHHLASLIAQALKRIQQDLFATGRFSWHHTVQINGRPLSYSS